jgi:hypothetical protein
VAQYEFTPVITATPDYTALDVLGTGNPYKMAGIVKRAGRFVILQSITVTDDSAQAPGLNVYFFDADPTNSTFTDNAVLSIHATDWAMCVGAIVLEAADYVTPDGNHRILTQKAIGLELGTSDTGDLWVVFQTIGAPNFDDTDNLTIRMNVVPSA